MGKRQYYFSNSKFYSPLRSKNVKRKKLIFLISGFLLLVFLLFIGSKWIYKSMPEKSDLNNADSLVNKNTESVPEYIETDDLGNLVEEKYFDGVVEKEEIVISQENSFSDEEIFEVVTPNTENKVDEIKNIPINEDDDGFVVNGCMKAGDTLYDSLLAEGISPIEILELQEKLKSIIDCNHIPVGAKYVLKYDPEGELKEFIYETSPLDVLHIKVSDSANGKLEVVQEEFKKEIVKIEGKIKSSLYESMLESADSPQLALQIADIFGWQIDFLTECREGDTFKILAEKQQRGDFYRWGEVIAAQYEGEHLSKHTAILFEDPLGYIDYYNEKGDSLRKAFLRAPLHYKYISSYFSKNRFHPILRIWRPHLAIDYAAPTGTPISTIGDGTVLFAGWKNGYGNYIQIRHPNNYVTGYGYLSRFASGLKRGKKVEQGEIIGYVGATGLATGPHLDFSISKNGERIDFLTLELPSASSVDSQYKVQFEELKNKLIYNMEKEGEMESLLAEK